MKNWTHLYVFCMRTAMVVGNLKIFECSLNNIVKDLKQPLPVCNRTDKVTISIFNLLP